MLKTALKLEMKPVRRTRLRIAAGKSWFTLRRYASWLINGKGLARQRLHSPLPHQAFAHSTPLYRRLRNVDMPLQMNKVVNLKLAAKRVDGIALYPGETFSYWRTIGKPTARKGYVEGMVLFYGTFRSGIGGGLCQLSNLIYWMTLYTPRSPDYAAAMGRVCAKQYHSPDDL